MKTFLQFILLGFILTVLTIGMISTAHSQNNPEKRKTVAAGSHYSSPLFKPEWKRSTVDVTKYSSGSLKISVTFDRCSGAVQFSEESSFNPNHNRPPDTKPVSLAVDFTKPTKFTIAILATCQPNMVGAVRWAVYLENGKQLPENPCNDEEIQIHFDKKSKDYHHYGPIETQICSTNNPKCNLNSVFSMMISQVRFITPTEDLSPVSDCMEVDVDIPGPFGADPTRVSVNAGSYSITNYTRKNHALYPGKVTRTIVEKNGGIYVATEGEGTGGFKELNEMKANGTWKPVDLKLREAFERGRSR